MELGFGGKRWVLREKAGIRGRDRRNLRNNFSGDETIAPTMAHVEVKELLKWPGWH